MQESSGILCLAGAALRNDHQLIHTVFGHYAPPSTESANERRRQHQYRTESVAGRLDSPAERLPSRDNMACRRFELAIKQWLGDCK